MAMDLVHGRPKVLEWLRAATKYAVPSICIPESLPPRAAKAASTARANTSARRW